VRQVGHLLKLKCSIYI